MKARSPGLPFRNMRIYKTGPKLLPSGCLAPPSRRVSDSWPLLSFPCSGYPYAQSFTHTPWSPCLTTSQDQTHRHPIRDTPGAEPNEGQEKGSPG